jgi:predicted nucleic acid-binding protein
MTAEQEAAPELQFVDTNVLVYAYDRSAGSRHQRARQLLAELWESGNGCLSVQVLQEFHVTVTRKVAYPLSSERSAGLIRDLSAWRVHAPSAEDVLAAIRLQERFQISIWDAMIVQSASRLDCAILWSEDLNAGQRIRSTKVRNPFS